MTGRSRGPVSHMTDSRRLIQVHLFKLGLSLRWNNWEICSHATGITADKVMPGAALVFFAITQGKPAMQSG